MVIGICILILMAIGMLYIMSRKELGDPLQRMGNYLYKFCCVHKLPMVERDAVRVDLERLYPGKSKRELQIDYYVNKLKLFLAILLVGILLTLLLCVKSSMERNSNPRGVERNPVGEGEQEVFLQAQVGQQVEELKVIVTERQLTLEELETLFEECMNQLEIQMLGENSGLKQVESNLLLADSLKEYPFEIVWKSSDISLINNRGELGNIQESAVKSVCLTATLYYGEHKYSKDFLVEFGEVQAESILLQQLKTVMQEKDGESRYEEEMLLPQELNGEPISWTVVKEDNSPVFLVLTLLAAIAVFLLKDKDLHEQVRERKKSLKMAYPGILNKFVLYMGAGMTVRGSFFKIATDYLNNPTQKAKNTAYEEMLYSCNELSAGVSEGLVYEQFGKRSGLQEYARFATMLGQNLKKGNAALLNRLREEADKAMQENLQFRKKIGEEAGTKLLVPMIMMMGIVMLLVMLPAFTSFE
ncbi:MAG: hypothetical protein IKK33_10665 [Lachnospiraceae bacterium]|nr:hypothetical protein [Lachnospiraceae bacterium]